MRFKFYKRGFVVFCASAGVKLWQIAEGLGVNDGNFSRRLRRELSADEKEKIFQIIDNFKEQEQAHE